MPNVPQELKEPEIPRQVGFADATKHPQVGLQQGEEALRPILMHLTARHCQLVEQGVVNLLPANMITRHEGV
jgi:hypothetical protein